MALDMVAKKRKAISVVEPVDHDEQTKKQKLTDFNISDVDFKNWLKDESTINSGLEEFVTVAKAYRNGEDCSDIVSQYCSSSPECKEIFAILDTPKKKNNSVQVALVYECLTHILQYVQLDNNSKLWSSADFIVQNMSLVSHMEQLYNYLKPSNTSIKIKRALQLLIAMVVLNKKAKRVVQAKFEFDNDVFPKLFQRRDRQDPEDVRSCIVLFTMSYIVDGDEDLVNMMVQQRNFIQLTVSGLVYDPKEMVMDVLATLLDKVVLNENVKRSDKLKLFNAKFLMQMVDLYEWEGPRGWKNDKKAFLTDVDFLEERSTVAKLVHDILLAICSPKKYGLVFLDKSFGTETRNFNPLMNRLLHYLCGRLDNPLKRKLAANILNFCPDQLSHFLAGWGKSLLTQGVDRRANAIDFLVETYKSQTPVPAFLSNSDMMPGDLDRLMSLMVAYYLPCDGLGVCINEGLRSNKLSVSHQCLVLMQVILHNAAAILSVITTKKIPHIPSGGFASMLSSAFASHAMKVLPPPPVLFVCVDNILNILSDPEKLDSIGTEVDLVEHVSTVLKTLSLYQQLCPSLLSERPSDVARLVEAVGRLQSIVDAAMEGVSDATAEPKTTVLPHLDLLKLLSETDVKKLPLVQGGILEKLLRSAHSLKAEYKEETVSLIYKLLTSLGILSDHKDELALWIGQALASETEWESFSPIRFLSDILGRVIISPLPYLDKIMEVVSEAGTSSRKDRKGLKDPTIRDVLEMDDEDLDLDIPTDLSDASNYQGAIVPFSPLIVAALEQLGSHDKDAVGVCEYVSAMLISILHTQPDPAQYSQLVTGCWVRGQPGLREYFDYWTGTKKTQSQSMPDINLKLVTPYSCRLLNWFTSIKNNDLDFADMEDLENIPEERKLSCLRQAILYMEHCFSPAFTMGHKSKRVKVLRKVITDIFTSYVNGFKTLTEENKMDVDVCEEKVGQEGAQQDHSEKDTEKMSAVVLYIINNAVVKEKFLSSRENNSASPSKSDENQRMTLLITKMVCDTLMACQAVKLAPSCSDVLEIYLERALDRLVMMKGEDSTDCLIAIQSISCHAHLPSINKCITTWLKFPTASFVSGNLSDVDITEVHKGQRSQLTPFGEVFVGLLDRWVKLLTLYHVTNVTDTSFLFTISSQSLQDGTNQTSQHPATVLMDTSDLERLFDLLLVCSNFDSPIDSIVSQLPDVGARCSHAVFTNLISHFVCLGEERRAMVEALVLSHSAFHQLGGNYIQKNAKSVFKKGHFGLVKAYLNKGGDTGTIHTICQELLSRQDIFSCMDNKLWACLHMLIESQDGPDDFHQGLFLAVVSFIPTNRSSTHFHHFSVLNAICKHLHGNTHSKTEDDFLELVLTFITHLTKRMDRNVDLEDKLTGLAIASLQRGGTLSDSFKAASWPGFVKSVLKHLYTRHASLEMLAILMPHMFGGKGVPTHSALPDPPVVFQMCVSHTAFLPTLMMTNGIPSKEALINLLHTLFTLQPTCITKELLTPFVGAYSASLSITDQQLLTMINASLLADENSNNQLPVLWGKAYLDQRAISKSLGRGNQSNASMDIVLKEIDSQRMEDTILHFPMKRKTKLFDVCPAGELMSKPDCYDPSSLLRIFIQVLTPDKKVPVRAFSEKNCLGFLLTCLSSKDHHCRVMAYKCLNDFYAHLESSPSPARHEFAFILDVLNASRTKNGQRISFVIALYLGRCIKQVLDPADHMYLRIMNFLCQKPQIDLSSLPEFVRFFFAGSPQYLKERTWMLALLRDGIRDCDDYSMYRRNSVFKHLMSFYSSFVSDKASKVMVLECIRNVCHQQRAVRDLVKDHGLIPWLSCVISGFEKQFIQVDIVADIIDSVCSSLEVKDLVENIDSLGHPSTSTELVKEPRSEVKGGGLDKDKGKGSSGKTENKERQEVPKSNLVGLDMLLKFYNQFVGHRRSLSRCV